MFSKQKTVDTILSVFQKTIDELINLESEKIIEQDTQTKIVDAAVKKRYEASIEANRASVARKKIESLISE